MLNSDCISIVEDKMIINSFELDKETEDISMKRKVEETKVKKIEENTGKEELEEKSNRRSKRIKGMKSDLSNELKDSIKKEEKKQRKEMKIIREIERKKEREEKEERRKKERIEREAKKEMEKEKKEAERLRKEKEKQLKEEERLKKKAEKDAKDQKKNEAKKKKEEKRENNIEKSDSQLKLQYFFYKTFPKENAIEIKDCFSSDYEKCFIPFFVKQYTLLSSQHAFVRNPDERMTIMKDMDMFLDSDFSIMSPIEHLLSLFKIKPALSFRHPKSHITVKYLLQKYEQSDSTEDLFNKLKIFPMKLLQFREDVRPPYYGTFSKSSFILTPRNPFKTDEHLFNYNYDSEAEWIEEEEGEDIDNMDDSEEEEDAAALKEDEDDRDFLDDEGELNNTKKKVIINLIPSVKGLYWQHSDNIDTDDYELFKKFRMNSLLDINLPINPYQDYWSPESNSNNDAKLQNSTIKTISSVLSPKPSLHFPQDSLPSFLKIIQGSTQTKVLLVETLRQKFSDISKQAIQWKLSTVARRNGKGVNNTWAVDPSVWHSVFGDDQNS
ncbi:hypothetical protein PNEG_01475 [Pneumocystis murina B123]|uniref:Chromatin assembly factor 1 subunit A n=1 Tax=Pneumocystis murina (strain B123) TaxID=1069680 RepID=M7NSG2_PNEMU|nr:hypothetical protein PNEG_01475 [Pneumocystis murina B123]EMR10202.1 hypothetical protein PNEG_01475 [Pneumocystis murina B123]